MQPTHTVSLGAANGWRGPGSIAIAIVHLGIATDFFVVRHLEPVALLVDLFFVLSGLLIAQVYSDKLRHASAIPEYIIRRFGRIWPVQMATLAVLLAYEVAKLILQTFAGKHFSAPAFSPDGLNLVQAIPTNVLLIHSLGIHDRETWNFPSWSLSVEFVTYAVFSAFCLVSPILRRVLVVTTVAASIAILVLVAPYHMRSTFDYGIFRCLAGFFAGALCYDVLRRWRLPAWPFPTIVEILAVVLLGAWMRCFDTGLAFAAPVVFCLFIVAFVPERGLISRVLCTKPFQFMAELSFSIYMVHAVVLIFALAFFHELERSTGARLFVPAPNPLAGHPGAIPTIQILHVDSIAARVEHWHRVCVPSSSARPTPSIAMSKPLVVRFSACSPNASAGYPPRRRPSSARVSIRWNPRRDRTCLVSCQRPDGRRYRPTEAVCRRVRPGDSRHDRRPLRDLAGLARIFWGRLHHVGRAACCRSFIPRLSLPWSRSPCAASRRGIRCEPAGVSSAATSASSSCWRRSASPRCSPSSLQRAR